MTATRALLFLFFALLLVPAPPAQAAGPGTVQARLYDAARVPDAVAAAALERAGTVLADAGMAIAWLPCQRRPAACAAPPAAGDLVLRLVRGRRPPAAGAAAPLGDALVDAHGGPGMLATIYVDRVSRLASSAGADMTALLGHAIAHEIGHLLMASTTHNERGLMRPVWSREELRRNRAEDWRFTDTERLALRNR
jgi:hypothetical protein